MNENLNNNDEINNSANNNINPNKSEKSMTIVLVLCGLIAVCIIGFIAYREFIFNEVNTNKFINHNGINEEKTKQNNDNNSDSRKNAINENNAETNGSKAELNDEINDETSNITTPKFDNLNNYIKSNSWNRLITDYDNAFYIDTSSINEINCDGSSFMLKNNGLNIETRCNKTRYDDLGYTYTYEIITKNNKIIHVSNGCYSCGCTNIYSNENYIIEYYSGCSRNGQSITINNINDGSEVYYNNNYENTDIVRPYLSTSSGDSNSHNEHGITISNNKLYYVLADYYAPYPDGKNTKCRLMMVDLSNSKFTETEIDSMDCYYSTGIL